MATLADDEVLCRRPGPNHFFCRRGLVYLQWPRHVFRLPLPITLFFVAFFNVFGLPLLLIGISRFISSWHNFLFLSETNG